MYSPPMTEVVGKINGKLFFKQCQWHPRARDLHAARTHAPENAAAAGPIDTLAESVAIAGAAASPAAPGNPITANPITANSIAANDVTANAATAIGLGNSHAVADAGDGAHIAQYHWPHSQ